MIQISQVPLQGGRIFLSTDYKILGVYYRNGLVEVHFLGTPFQNEVYEIRFFTAMDYVPGYTNHIGSFMTQGFEGFGAAVYHAFLK